jgi:hypothetical protein
MKSLIRSFATALTLLSFTATFAGAQETSSPERPAPAVVVSFDGGVVGENLGKVLNVVLDANGTVKTEPYTVGSGNESACSILAKLGFPPPCQPLEKVLDRLNPSNPPSKGTLKATEIIKVPQLKMYQSGRIFSKNIQSDATKSKDMTTNWANLNVRREDRSKNTYDLKYDAFELYIPTRDDTESRGLFNKLFPLKTTNVLVGMIKQKPTEVDLHSIPASKFREWCVTGEAFNHTIDYVDYSESHDVDAIKVLKSAPPNASVRVPVRLIDVPLIAAPNLYPAYGDAAPSELPACSWAKFSSALHHATHLAGIIFSAGLGFHGIASNVDLSNSFTWAIPDDQSANSSNELKATSVGGDRQYRLAQTVADSANDVGAGKPRTVFVAATTFDDYEQQDIEELTKGRSEVRFTRQPERDIRHWFPLLVVSAGQADPEDQHINDRLPRLLSKTTALSPQNLGDLPNVLVVTACDICSREDARLLSIANYGGGEHNYVQVAAPGGQEIPGWIDKDHVGSARGTSQAAAYVAGLVAAMISNYPNNWDIGGIKQRVQVTSWPFVLRADRSRNPDASKIAAGLVDPILALLDPSKHWVKDNGAWREVRIRAWTGAMNFRDPQTGDEVPVPVKAKYVRRVVRVASASGNRPPQVVIYTDRSHEQTDAGYGEIRRVGPVELFGESKAAIVFCDSKTERRLDAIDDLILGMAGSTGNECVK